MSIRSWAFLDPTYKGWYVEGSWFFGGHKTYEEGPVGSPEVNNPMFHGSNGWGALQLAANLTFST